MIDAGVYGQLPSLINGGIIADTFGACIFASGTSPGTGGLLSGTHILISIPYTVKGTHLNVYGNLTIFGMGTALAHDLIINIDGADVASQNAPCCCPTAGSLAASLVDVAYQGSQTPGLHTIQLRYFIQSTGVGFDIIGGGQMTIEDCP